MFPLSESMTPLQEHPAHAPEVGEYLCSDRDLYRVERVMGERVLLEDCMTMAVLDVSVAEVGELRPVRRASNTPAGDEQPTEQLSRL